MVRLITPESIRTDRALAAASQLQATLTNRLVGRRIHGDHCICSAQNDRITAVRMPESVVDMGRFTNWLCDVQSNCGQTSTVALFDSIDTAELYAIFRKAFADTGVALNQPWADLYLCSSEHDQTRPAALPFKSSGVTLTLTADSKRVQLRPIAADENSAWVNAQIEAAFNGGVATAMLSTIDFTMIVKEFPRRLARRAATQGLNDAAAFYIYFRRPCGQSHFAPLARLTSWQDGEIVLDLPEGVGQFSL